MLRLRSDVRITPLRPEHADRMYRWMRDPVVASSIGLRSVPSPERTAAWIGNSMKDPLIRAYAVLLEEQHVGNVILDKWDTYLKTCRLSVYIGESSARRNGVGRTAVYRALAEGFTNHDLHKVWLTVHADNSGAIKTYATLGFKLEGVLREEFLLGNRRIDAHYMGILRPEFEAVSKTL